MYNLEPSQSKQVHPWATLGSTLASPSQLMQPCQKGAHCVQQGREPLGRNYFPDPATSLTFCNGSPSTCVSSVAGTIPRRRKIGSSVCHHPPNASMPLPLLSSSNFALLCPTNCLTCSNEFSRNWWQCCSSMRKMQPTEWSMHGQLPFGNSRSSSCCYKACWLAAQSLIGLGCKSFKHELLFHMVRRRQKIIVSGIAVCHQYALTLQNAICCKARCPGFDHPTACEITMY